jgi:hypothetical protein
MNLPINTKTAAFPYVSIEPMQRHINNGQTVINEFTTAVEAIDYFYNYCEQRGINTDISSAQGFTAGGIGHDFFIQVHLGN